MKYYHQFKKEKNGFVLIFVMLIISGLTILLIGVSSLIYSAKGMLSSMVIQEEAERTLKTSLEYITSLLNKIDPEKEKKDSLSENKKSAEDFDKYKPYALNLIYLMHRPIEYTFKYDIHGVDATIKFYITSEDGKLPLKNYIHLLRKEDKEKDSEAGKVKTQEEKKTSEKDNLIEEEEKKNKNYFDSDNGKRVEKICTFLEEKSGIFETSAKDEDKGKLKTILENYLKKKDILITDSLSILYNLPIKNLYNNPLKNEKPKLGNMCSIMNNLINLIYLAPSFLGLISSEAKEKPFTEDQSKKIKENLKKILENTGQSFTLESSLNALYKDIYKIDKLKDLEEGIKSDVELALVPSRISVFVDINEHNNTKSYIIFFNKIERLSIIQFLPIKIIPMS